ncbi:MAG: hypothetical protein GY716_17700 [bacterium]|nr:hypothetical protein [bacterium]
MRIFVSTIVLALSISLAVAEAPRVVQVTPENGAKGVDPGLREVRVVFDTPMGEDYSFMEGAGRFPELSGKVLWADDRTCVLAVSLQPGTEYFVGINTGSGEGFKSVDGTPAAGYELRFKTSGKPLSAEEENLRVVDHLRRLIQDRYSYRDRVVKNWDAEFKKHREALENAADAQAFATTAATLLTAADDMHIWLEAGGRRYGTKRNRVETNFKISGIRAAVSQLELHNRTVASGRFEDGVGYVLIRSWSNHRARELDVLDDVIDGMLDAPGIIVDLRANTGGDEKLARHFAGRFVSEPAVYAKSVLRDPDAKKGWSRVNERTLNPRKGPRRYEGRLVVLQGELTTSSAEASVLMLRTVPGSKTVGSATNGRSGNPQAYDLANGVRVYLPRWKAMDAEGREFEGEGIAPDVEVKATQEQFDGGDPVIEKALELIRSSK